MTTTANCNGNTIGHRLAAALGLPIIGTEGHDLRLACIACKSSDAGRVHQDEGVYHCYSCGKNLNAFDLCKAVVGHDAAIRIMVDVGLFTEVYENGKGSNGHTAGGNGKPAPALTDNEIIDRLAAAKGTTGDGFRAYGAVVSGGSVVFPTFRLDGEKVEQVSYFRIVGPEDKGKNAKDKPAGVFLPAVVQDGKVEASHPQPGETCIMTEGGKNGAAYHTLGYRAVGLNGKHVKKDFLAGFVEAFAGVDVVLAPDGDKQSVKAFRELGAALDGTAASVRFAKLPYGDLRATGGNDVRDVLRQDGPEAVRKAIEAAKPIEEQEGEDSPRFLESLVTSRQLVDEPSEVSYLVEDTLTAGEPGTVGGPAKCLKTLTMVDLVLSVASGTPFLNRFRVLQAGPVVFLSGESGRAVLRRAALRIAAAKGIDLRELPITWGFTLPQLTVKEHVEALGELVVKTGAVLVGLDPTFLCLLNAANAGQAGNLFAMGAALAPLSEMVGRTGATVVLLHHYRKNRPDNGGEPADLQDLAMSGMMEWSRFWLLLDRIESYANDGLHKLWLRAGGSAGHAGLYGLTVNERAGESGDGWHVGVEHVGDVRRSIQDAKQNRRAADLERLEGNTSSVSRKPYGNSPGARRPASWRPLPV